MNELIKFGNVSKYMTALKAADTMRTVIYASVVVITAFNVFKLFKAFAEY